jgi:hypothetical protein
MPSGIQHHIVSLKQTNISEVHTAPLIAMMMEAVHTSQTSVNFTRLYGNTSQMAVIFKININYISDKHMYILISILKTRSTDKDRRRRKE